MLANGNSLSPGEAPDSTGRERSGNSWLFAVPGLQKLGNAL